MIDGTWVAVDNPHWPSLFLLTFPPSAFPSFPWIVPNFISFLSKDDCDHSLHMWSTPSLICPSPVVIVCTLIRLQMQRGQLPIESMPRGSWNSPGKPGIRPTVLDHPISHGHLGSTSGLSHPIPYPGQGMTSAEDLAGSACRCRFRFPLSPHGPRWFIS